MPGTSRARLLALAALGAAAFLTAGCGSGGLSEGGDVARGKQLFVNGLAGKQSCGSCHAMADAGSTGIPAYPNLDDAFSASRKEGYDESTFQQVVRDQIELANPPMPRNLVRGDDADAVAAYVAMCAAWTKRTPCATAAPPSGGETTTTSGGGGTTTAPTTGGGGGGNGEALYTSLGCQGCHTLDGQKSAGPTFKGLSGKQEKLANGQTVTASDAYLLESILDPDKQIVAGYAPGIMTAVIKPGQVSRDDANALVAFIKAQK